MSKNKKLCPVMSYHKQYVNQNDCTEECAWYDHQNENCCIFSFMKHMELMTEVCDGSRTLFVREC